MVTIVVSGISFLAHGGRTFTSATAAQRLGVSRKTADVLRSQPGYVKGKTMCVRFCGPELRLYVRVGHVWMDASLQSTV
jgi:hypothetical protein